MEESIEESLECITDKKKDDSTMSRGELVKILALSVGKAVLIAGPLVVIGGFAGYSVDSLLTGNEGNMGYFTYYGAIMGGLIASGYRPEDD